MTLWARTVALLALFTLASPAVAQTLAVRAWSVPVEGQHEVKIGYSRQDNRGCVGVEMNPRPGVTAFLRGAACQRAVVFTMRFISRDRVTLEVNGSGKCATVARGVVLGPASIDVLPCNNDLDQQFTLIRDSGNIVMIQGPGGCWTERFGGTIHNDVVEERCEGRVTQDFRIIDARPPADTGPAQVAPATTDIAAPPSTSDRPVARPVETAPPVTRIAPIPARERTAPVRLPGPGEGTSPITYRLAPAGAADGADCYRWIGGARGMTPRVDPGPCRDAPEAEVTAAPGGDGSFSLTMNQPALCFTTGEAPWVTLVRCTAAESQVFRISPAGAPGQYTITTGTGLCLTQRGNPNENPAQNNSALFAEPCRDAPEQAFAFRPVRR